MNPLLQPGQLPSLPPEPHPDADQLCAFAENALSTHERDRTLAHLAICPDCRAVLALGQTTLEDLPEAAPEPIRQPWSSGWKLAGWRLVWPALALAALVLLTLFLRKPITVLPRTESALATTPPQPASSNPPALPIPPAPSLQQRRPAPPPKTPAIVLGRPTPPPTPPTTQADAIVDSKSIADLPLQSRGMAGMTPAAPQPALEFNGAMGKGAGAAVALDGSANGGVAAPSNAAAIPRPVTLGAPHPPPLPAAPASQTVEVAADAIAIPSADQPTIRSRALNRTPSRTPSLPMKTPLPSGLAALSVASGGHSLVALDTAHNLFSSHDDGEHWTAVPSQWPTRAIRVALASSTQLSGLVTDSTGAVIPGATITLTAPNQIYSATTNAGGQYALANLPPGTYRAETRAPGFASQMVSQLALTPDRQAVANVTLRAGSVSETVTVETAQAMPQSILKTKQAPKQPANRQPAGPEPAAPISPLFELTTDAGLRFTSPDGTTWKPK